MIVVQLKSPGYRRATEWIGKIAHFADESGYDHCYYSPWRRRGDTMVYAEVKYKDVNRPRKWIIALLW